MKVFDMMKENTNKSFLSSRIDIVRKKKQIPLPHTQTDVHTYAHAMVIKQREESILISFFWTRLDIKSERHNNCAIRFAL